MKLPRQIDNGTDLARVYTALYGYGRAPEGFIGRRAMISDPVRIKYMLNNLRALGVADRAEHRTHANVWEMQRDPLRTDADVSNAVRLIVLESIRERPDCAIVALVEATGLTPTTIRGAIRTLKTRGDITETKEAGACAVTTYAATKTVVQPIVGMVAGPGERHNCELSAACLGAFAKRDADAEECHCVDGCVGLKLVSREALLRKATTPRGSIWAEM